VTLTARELNKVQAKADEIKQRLVSPSMPPRQSHGRDKPRRWLARKSRFCCARGRAGSIGFDAVGAKSLLVSADVNAVPPAGIEGLDLMANGVELAAAVSDRAARIGDVKYKTESGLFQRMASSPKAISLDFRCLQFRA